MPGEEDDERSQLLQFLHVDNVSGMGKQILVRPEKSCHSSRRSKMKSLFSQEFKQSDHD